MDSLFQVKLFPAKIQLRTNEWLLFSAYVTCHFCEQLRFLVTDVNKFGLSLPPRFKSCLVGRAATDWSYFSLCNLIKFDLIRRYCRLRASFHLKTYWPRSQQITLWKWNHTNKSIIYGDSSHEYCSDRVTTWRTYIVYKWITWPACESGWNSN